MSDPDLTPEGMERFTRWFCRNYPGPDTIIYDPKWHAPRIFQAATRAASAKMQALEAERDNHALGRRGMHRRAQIAEGKLARITWWVEAVRSYYEAVGNPYVYRNIEPALGFARQGTSKAWGLRDDTARAQEEQKERGYKWNRQEDEAWWLKKEVARLTAERDAAEARGAERMRDRAVALYEQGVDWDVFRAFPVFLRTLPLRDVVEPPAEGA